MTHDGKNNADTNQSGIGQTYSRKLFVAGLVAAGVIIASVFWFFSNGAPPPEATSDQLKVKEPKGDYYLLTGKYVGEPKKVSGVKGVKSLILFYFPPGKFDTRIPADPKKKKICRVNGDIDKSTIGEFLINPAYNCKSIVEIRYWNNSIRIISDIHSQLDLFDEWSAGVISKYKKGCGFAEAKYSYGYFDIHKKGNCKNNETNWGFLDAGDGIEDLLFSCGFVNGKSNKCRVLGRLHGWRFSVVFDDKHVADWRDIYTNSKKTVSDQIKYAISPNGCIGELCD